MTNPNGSSIQDKIWYQSSRSIIFINFRFFHHPSSLYSYFLDSFRGKKREKEMEKKRKERKMKKKSKYDGEKDRKFKKINNHRHHHAMMKTSSTTLINSTISQSLSTPIFSTFTSNKPCNQIQIVD